MAVRGERVRCRIWLAGPVCAYRNPGAPARYGKGRGGGEPPTDGAGCRRSVRESVPASSAGASAPWPRPFLTGVSGGHHDGLSVPAAEVGGARQSDRTAAPLPVPARQSVHHDVLDVEGIPDDARDERLVDVRDPESCGKPYACHGAARVVEDGPVAWVRHGIDRVVLDPERSQVIQPQAAEGGEMLRQL